MSERYTLLTEIGRGGMGVIWKARDLETGSIVTLKLLNQAHADEPEYQASFERELELAMRVHSRNVVEVLGYGVREGVPFLVLEYVDGPSLRQVLTESGPYPWAEARTLLSQIAEGLAAVHAAGVMHGDVKPSNILIGPGGVAKLTDFGVARRLGNLRVGEERHLFGTPAYLAPEGLVDERSDLYCLGVVAYELLTGNVPFDGTDWQQVMVRHIREAPNLERIPREARAIVRRLLAKDPNDRVQRASDLVALLGRQTIAVVPSFEYVHEPWSGESAIPFLGGRREVTTLADRIAHSRGGTIVVTGFRGVGKSSVVGQALGLLDERTNSLRVLPVVLSVAHPVSADELLYAVIRRTFEKISDEGLLESLPPDAAQALLLAYLRTSVSLSESRSSSAQGNVGIKLDIASLPNLEIGRTSTRSLATQASFLAYSQAEAEHDFVRFVHLATQAQRPRPRAGSLYRLRGLVRRTSQRPEWPRRIIIVLEELDKLTSPPDGKGLACLTELLGRLRNVLTLRGVHFVLVCGVDVHDALVDDVQRGNSVYASVFSSEVYVPCQWSGAAELLARVTHPGVDEGAVTPDMGHYLNYKARGLPRLLLQELNMMVRWDGNAPALSLDTADQMRIGLYSRIEQASRTVSSSDSSALSRQVDLDRRRMAEYHLIDWLLTTRGRSFPLEEFAGVAEHQLDPSLRINRSRASDILDLMCRRAIVERVEATGLGDAPPPIFYRLAPSFARDLGEVFDTAERVEVDLGPQPPPMGYPQSGTRVGERYRLEQVIGRGASSVLWLGYDLLGSRAVAVKLLTPRVGASVDRERFLREGRICMSVAHPNIVETYDVFDSQDGGLGIAMSLISGESLGQVVSQGPMDPVRAVDVVLRICAAVEYLHRQGLARLDLKPANIMIEKDGRPILVDLGLAKSRPVSPDDGVTREIEWPIGTPRYMAPEQFYRMSEIDPRSDIFALGLVLYEMIAGRPVREAVDLRTILAAGVENDVTPLVSSLPVSEALRATLARSLRVDVGQRFQTAAELGQALSQTPEGSAATEAGAQ
jgi:serine/threonine-protein kinase